MSQAYATIVVAHGNTVVIPFRLRLKGQKNGFDVSAATKIQLDVDDPDGNPMPPIEADPLHPLADWAKGEAPIEINPTNVTGRVGTYEAVVTLFMANEEVSAPVKHTILIEVSRRPGYPAPTPP